MRSCSGKGFFLGVLSIFGFCMDSALSQPSLVESTFLDPPPFRKLGFGFQSLFSVPPLSKDNKTMNYQLAHKDPSVVIQPHLQIDTRGGGISVGPLARLSSSGPIWAVGGSFQYQLRYIGHQIVVPTLGYSFESNHPKDENEWFTIHGPTVGTQILLNKLEKQSTRLFYQNAGVRRTSLVAEVQIPHEDWSGEFNWNVTSYVGFRLDW